MPAQGLDTSPDTRLHTGEVTQQLSRRGNLPRPRSPPDTPQLPSDTSVQHPHSSALMPGGQATCGQHPALAVPAPDSQKAILLSSPSPSAPGFSPTAHQPEELRRSPLRHGPLASWSHQTLRGARLTRPSQPAAMSHPTPSALDSYPGSLQLRPTPTGDRPPASPAALQPQEPPASLRPTALGHP